MAEKDKKGNLKNKTAKANHPFSLDGFHNHGMPLKQILVCDDSTMYGHGGLLTAITITTNVRVRIVELEENVSFFGFNVNKDKDVSSIKRIDNIFKDGKLLINHMDIIFDNDNVSVTSDTGLELYSVPASCLNLVWQNMQFSYKQLTNQ